MRDARPETRTMVVDWSGRRMLAVREPAGVGPDAWGLIKRLASIEGFGGVAARWAESRFLVSRVANLWADMFAIAPGRSWDFLADAPEGEVLALRGPAADEQRSPIVIRRARRPGPFAPRTGTPKRMGRPGDHRRDPGGLAREALGFVRLRSEVPMGTAITARELSRFPASGSRESPFGGAGRGTGLPGGTDAGPEIPSRRSWFRDASWLQRSVPRRRGRSPAWTGGNAGPRGPAQEPALAWSHDRLTRSEWFEGDLSAADGKDAVTGALGINIGTAVHVPEGMGLSHLALESPESTLLIFTPRFARGRESPAVYPERIATRFVSTVPDATTVSPLRVSRRSAVWKVGFPPEAATPSVARATFTPRRAGVEAPWFAPPAPAATVYGRSVGFVEMTPAGFPGPALMRGLQGDRGPADLTWTPIRTLGSNLSRLVAVSGGTAPVPMARPDYMDIAWTLGTEDAALLELTGRPTVMGGAVGHSTPLSRPWGLDQPRLRTPSEGPPRVYPERIITRIAPEASEDATIPEVLGAATALPASGIRTATFLSRRVGTVARPDVQTDVVTVDEVLRALGMKGLGTGEVSGALSPMPPLGSGQEPGVPRPGVARTSRVFGTGAWAAPWASTGALERTFLALPGVVGPRTGIATPRGRSLGFPQTGWPTLARSEARVFADRGSRDDTFSGTAPRTMGIAGWWGLRERPLPAVSGTYGTTPLARWMAPPAGTVGISRGRAEGGVFAGSAEAEAWMIEGLLRLGLPGMGARPQSAVSGTYGTTPLARWVAPPAGTVGTSRGREEGGVFAGSAEAEAWMIEGLLRLGLPGMGGRPRSAVSGMYGTTPLARWVAPPAGTVGTSRGREEGGVFAGSAEAETWMIEGLLRLGLPGMGGRPRSAVSGMYGTTALARWMAPPAGTVGTSRGRAEGGVFAGSAEAEAWMIEGLLRLGLPGVGRVFAGSPQSGTKTGVVSTSHRVSRGRRDAGASPREMGPESRRPDETPVGTAKRFGQTPVTRTLAFGAIPAGESQEGATALATAVTPTLPRVEEVSQWGFAGDVETVFLQIPWAERLQHVDWAVGPSVTRIAGRASPRWSPETLAPATVRVSRLRGGAGLAGTGFDGLHAGTPGRRASVGRAIHTGEPVGGLAVVPGAGPEGQSGTFTPWGVPPSIGEDGGTLLVLTRPAERHPRGTPEGFGLGEGTGSIRAGTMWFIQRTLGRALRALPPESFGEVGPGGDVASGLVPADLARVLGIVPVGTRAPREAAEISREGTGGVAGDLVIPPGPEMVREPARVVRPERVEARTPGLPEEPVTLELSLQDAGPAGPVVGPGALPSLGGLIRTGETPGPTLRGLPLVSPVIQAVASQAMLSRRTEGAASRPTPAPGGQAPATGSQAAGSQPIDLDILAMEMAERILRRMKRDKERRGHHD